VPARRPALRGCAVIPAALLFATLAGFAVGALFMALGSRSSPPAERRQRWGKFAGYVLIVHGVLLAAWWGPPAPALVAVLVALASALEIIRAWHLCHPRPSTSAALVLLLAGCGFVAQAARLPPAAFAWFYLVCAAFDGFSQVTGQWRGRRLLAPRISPHKTWEGLAGGAVAATLLGAWLHTLVGSGALAAAALGALCVPAALSGDLAGSWLKRRAGIKDYSNLLPGHGGVFDRFNSFIAVLAAVPLIVESAYIP
jgi:phosphatidate cytidylyltransferase